MTLSQLKQAIEENCQPFFQSEMGKGRCGGDEDEDETDAYDPSDKGPNSKRGCTDVPCLLLLAAFIIPFKYFLLSIED